jgi:hypothetical protein
LEAVHPRHLDVADDDIEILASLAQAKRAIRRFDGRNLVPRNREERRQEIAEERRIIDDENTLAVVFLSVRTEPILEG